LLRTTDVLAIRYAPALLFLTYCRYVSYIIIIIIIINIM